MDLKIVNEHSVSPMKRVVITLYAVRVLLNTGVQIFNIKKEKEKVMQLS